VEFEKITRRLNSIIPGFRDLSSINFYNIEKGKLKIMYTGKRKGRSVTGEFCYLGQPVEPQSWYHEEDWNCGKKEGLHYAKCVSASACSFAGTLDGITAFCFQPAGNPYDLFTATLSLPKWIKIQAYFSIPKPSNSANDFFGDDHVPSMPIREHGRLYVPDRYLNHYDGSYINSATDPSGFCELLNKLEGVRGHDGKIVMNDSLTSRQRLICIMLFLDGLNFKNSDVPLDLSREVCVHDYYRPSAAYGFDGFLEKTTGVKGSYVLLNRQHIAYLVDRVFNHGESWDSLLPCPAYVMATKAEVRGPNVKRSKIRVLMTNNMITDFIFELLLRPTYTWCKNLPWYLAGINTRGNFVYKILKTVRHPYARCVYRDAPIYSGPCAIIDGDLSSQDTSYTAVLKFSLMFLLVGLLRRPVHSQLRSLLAYLFAYSIFQPVNTWGGHWFLVMAILCTGGKLTALLNALMNYFNLKAVIYLCAPLNYIEVLKWFWVIVFGDDFLARVPVGVAKGVFGNSLAKFVDLAYKRMGIVYKLSDSHLLYPTSQHKDRLFTHVENDLIVSRGCVHLKRYLVKIDDHCNLIHPDSTDFKAILLWRPTSDFVERFCLDPEEWGVGSPWVKWFRKQFGLIVDAGANREVHFMIKNAVNSAKEDHPSDWDLASSGYKDSSEYRDLCKKTGLIDHRLFDAVFSYPDSFRLICALYVPNNGENFSFESFYINKPASWVLP